jgi:hypothetical protein
MYPYFTVTFETETNAFSTSLQLAVAFTIFDIDIKGKNSENRYFLLVYQLRAILLELI